MKKIFLFYVISLACFFSVNVIAQENVRVYNNELNYVLCIDYYTFDCDDEDVFDVKSYISQYYENLSKEKEYARLIDSLSLLNQDFEKLSELLSDSIVEVSFSRENVFYSLLNNKNLVDSINNVNDSLLSLVLKKNNTDTLLLKKKIDSINVEIKALVVDTFNLSVVFNKANSEYLVLYNDSIRLQKEVDSLIRLSETFDENVFWERFDSLVFERDRLIDNSFILSNIFDSVYLVFNELCNDSLLLVNEILNINKSVDFLRESIVRIPNQADSLSLINSELISDTISLSTQIRDIETVNFSLSLDTLRLYDSVSVLFLEQNGLNSDIKSCQNQISNLQKDKESLTQAKQRLIESSNVFYDRYYKTRQLDFDYVDLNLPSKKLWSSQYVKEQYFYEDYKYGFVSYSYSFCEYGYKFTSYLSFFSSLYYSPYDYSSLDLFSDVCYALKGSSTNNDPAYREFGGWFRTPSYNNYIELVDNCVCFKHDDSCIQNDGDNRYFCVFFKAKGGDAKKVFSYNEINDKGYNLSDSHLVFLFTNNDFDDAFCTSSVIEYSGRGTSFVDVNPIFFHFFKDGSLEPYFEEIPYQQIRKGESVEIIAKGHVRGISSNGSN